MRLKTVIICVLICTLSCGPNAEEFIPHVNGYWQISAVKKDNKIVSEYSVSPIIDYWQINEDYTGFRKKVMPNLEGKLIVTQHSAPFTISVKNNELLVKYNDNGNVFQETIIKATSEELVITNEQGLEYIYKPYESIELNNE